METKDLLTQNNFPKPAKRSKGRVAGAKLEKKLQGLEAAAIAYVQMENGEYRYPEGANRMKDAEGNPEVNKRELMRRAGYSPGSLNKFDEYMANDERFWELVELHRLRRTDPMFRREHENQLWTALGGEALRNIYETLFYYPHSLTTEQHIKIVKLILDAGITLQKLGGDKPNRTAELLGSIDEESRDRVMKGYKEKLLKDLEEVEQVEMANRAVDRKENGDKGEL
jgi:hypothetical protein